MCVNYLIVTLTVGLPRQALIHHLSAAQDVQKASWDDSNKVHDLMAQLVT